MITDLGFDADFNKLDFDPDLILLRHFCFDPFAVVVLKKFS